jgi:CRISPR-associated endonuclease/helicase Cas3
MQVDQQTALPDWLILIGKWGDSIEGHALIYHSLDSAAVAQLLWQQGLTPGARRQFAQWLSLPEADCGRLLAFWTSLHDIGKATPSFQKKHKPTQSELERRGFTFPPLAQTEIRHHSLLSQWILQDFAADLNIQPAGVFNQFRYAIGGHHGVFHFQEDFEETLAPSRNLGTQPGAAARWRSTRREFFNALSGLLAPPAVPAFNLAQTESNALFNLLTGFFVAADWIASQDNLFPYQPALPRLEDYWALAQQRALAALTNTGWIGWQPDHAFREFNQLFPFPPRPLQQMVLDSAESLQNPFLMIIEAPTGCGKTEAALIAAERAIQKDGLRGCYIAMPTQATSNQMFNRMKEFLQKRYPQQTNINLQLAHGNALINEDFQEMQLSAVDGIEGSLSGNVNALEWFLPRKRTLLAPFGVGTVDQTFLSVLRTRHSFLRLFGLHRKVIIFDEVHAYDTYMQKIFQQLLAWLRAIGSSVILLSATLPHATRLALLTAFQPAAVVQSTQAAYPRLSINDGKTITTASLGAFPNRTVHLQTISRDSQTWPELLREKLAAGGCAAIICNTVDRAQQVYQQLSTAALVEKEDLFLLHARMPYCWREQKETKILTRFGKQSQPAVHPRRGIVVATQIIEQSLDLDFDLLISDLAPIDLLIQRIGRLQRHTGSPNAPLRPPLLAEPLCLINQPDPTAANELPGFGADEWVYDPVTLQRTYYCLVGRQSLSLPADSDALINQVYADDDLLACSPAQNQLMRLNYQKMLKDQAAEMVKAQNQLVGDVDSNAVLGNKSAYLKEEDQAISGAAQALTRNTVLPNVQLVCFIQQAGQTFLLDGMTPFDPNAVPHKEVLKHLLRSQVAVSKAAIVHHFIAQPPHAAWKRTPSLRLAHPLIFENGICRLNEKIVLSLDQDLGLVVIV